MPPRSWRRVLGAETGELEFFKISGDVDEAAGLWRRAAAAGARHV
jgi:hypothetical protein